MEDKLKIHTFVVDWQMPVTKTDETSKKIFEQRYIPLHTIDKKVSINFLKEETIITHDVVHKEARDG